MCQYDYKYHYVSSYIKIALMDRLHSMLQYGCNNIYSCLA